MTSEATITTPLFSNESRQIQNRRAGDPVDTSLSGVLQENPFSKRVHSVTGVGPGGRNLIGFWVLVLPGEEDLNLNFCCRCEERKIHSSDGSRRI